MSKLIKLSIEVTAIPKDKIKAHTNGKSYVSIDCWVNDEPDRFGKDVSLNISPSKEERDAKAPKIYCGGGETKWGFEKSEQPKKIDRWDVSKDDSSDIPF